MRASRKSESEHSMAKIIATIEGSDTPLSGWHWVCPCGFSAFGRMDPPTEKVEAHRRWHQSQVRALTG